MELEFLKIQATGNDFVVVNYDAFKPSFLTKEQIVHICNRNFGIGADGLIALEKTEKHAFRFHYYNSDGSRGEMCANGCRAAVRFAEAFKWLQNEDTFSFVADDGEHSGIINNNSIRVSLRQGSTIDKIETEKYKLADWVISGYKVNTGVPHLVLICKDNLQQENISGIGKMLRFHEDFMPEGTNVNFVEFRDRNVIFVRTFERGVDAETLSCGTGVTASALVFSKIKKLQDPLIFIKSAGGDLQVKIQNGQLFLQGPSEISFKGTISL